MCSNTLDVLIHMLVVTVDSSPIAPRDITKATPLFAAKGPFCEDISWRML